MLIAKLDAQGRLIGTRRGKPKEDDVVLPDDCDLPTDGTYRWDAARQAFWPLAPWHQRVTTMPRAVCEIIDDRCRAMARRARR